MIITLKILSFAESLILWNFGSFTLESIGFSPLKAGLEEEVRLNL
jgi:hypothetical protein